MIKKVILSIMASLFFLTAAQAGAQRFFITPERLTPAALMKAYDTNFVEADTKYTGKLVILTGRIRVVTPESHPYRRADDAFVVFEAGQYQPVAVYFWHWDAEMLRNLPSGNVVSIMGFCQGVFPQMSLISACLYPKGCGGPVEKFYGPHYKTPPTPRK